METDLTCTNPAIQAAYVGYRNSAKHLKEAPEMISLSAEIYRMYHGCADPTPFIGIGAPSGSGKTQMAFTLALDDSLEVLHVCLAPEADWSQNVYRHPEILEISSALRTYLSSDYLSAASSTLSCAGIKDTRLRVVGLLSRVFRVVPHGPAHPLTPAAFRDALRSRKEGDKWPVVVVDEAYQRASDRVEIGMAVFLRTVLRACGLVSIFMGTTINMVDFIGGPSGTDFSAGETAPTEWATLVTQLPQYSFPFDPSSIRSEDVRTLVEILLTNFRHVNPRTMRYLCDAAVKFNEAATIDEVLLDVAERLYAGKALLRTITGVRAQVHFLLDVDTSEKSARVLVGCHFARYAADLQISRAGASLKATAGGASAIWRPVPHFPPSRTDPLLPLLLGGPSRPGGHPSPFVIADASALSNREPTHLTSIAAILLSVDNSDSNTMGVVTDTGNKRARTRNGNILESAVSLACINASRANGVAGIPALDFLRHVVMELLPVVLADELTWAEDPQLPYQDVSTVLSELAQVSVPYVTRVADEFAPTADGINVAVHSYVRPGNLAMVDGYVLDIFQDEEKNYAKSVGIKDVCKIHDRFLVTPPGHPPKRFGLAIVSKLAELRGSLKGEHPDTNLFHLVVKDNELYLKALLPDDRKQRMAPRPRNLFFIECDEDEVRSTFQKCYPALAAELALKVPTEPTAKKLKKDTFANRFKPRGLDVN
jgi:hypothetical protein